MTAEGPQAYKEAIAFLQEQKGELKELIKNNELKKAAQEHADDIGGKGIVGHIGTNGSTIFSRVGKYAYTQGKLSENISLGDWSGIEAVASMVVDDGFVSRGHRNNIFSNEFTQIGIGINRHKAFGIIIVVDFSTDMQLNKEIIQQQEELKSSPQKSIEMKELQRERRSSLKGFDKKFAELTIENQQSNKKKQVRFMEDPDMPEGTIEKYVQKSIRESNGVKYLIENRRYIIKDGSVKEIEKEIKLIQ